MGAIPRRKVFWLAGAVVTAGLASGIPAVWRWRTDPGGRRKEPAALPENTAKITRQTLVHSVKVAGKLSHGTPVPLALQGQGTITWLPVPGQVIARGQTVVRVDERPVVLLYGPLPMYRPLALGTKGTDVGQLKANLRALGYRGLTGDENFTKATENAVKRWQRDVGSQETGTLEPGRVIYTGDAIRVAALNVRVGAPASGDALQYTGTVKVVTLNVPAAASAWAVNGTAVSVTLPGGKAIAGEITDVGIEASGSEQEGAAGATVPVTISVPDQQALGSLEKSPVDVSHDIARRENVLAAPVAALLALAEGGFGLEVVEAGSARVVAVEIGMAANGFIEVRGAGITEGTTVGIAA